ncbi:MAG: hypothetical protein EOO03_08105, partial [Chitinophagaceae bacterium]
MATNINNAFLNGDLKDEVYMSQPEDYVDPRYPGFECWVAGAGISGMYNVKGIKISEKSPAVNFGVFWDADFLSEILNSTVISKWDYINSKSDEILNAGRYNCVSNNGSKSTPVLSADLLGDWREEV